MKYLYLFGLLHFFLSGCAPGSSRDSDMAKRSIDLIGLDRRAVEAVLSSRGISSINDWNKTSYLDPATKNSVIVTYALKSDAFHSPDDKVKRTDIIKNASMW